MTEAKGAITAKQITEIRDMHKKWETTGKLTDAQGKRLKELEYKRDNPQLSGTVKGYCRDWLKSIIYGRRIEFTSKYTEKGLIMEDESIDFLSEQLGLGLLFKNEQKFEDEFMTGETDINFPDYVFDVKNSWSWETFPLLEMQIPNPIYYWQLQGYMHLTDKDHAKLIYVLSDTPQHLIEREAKNYCFYNGYGELDMDIYNDFHKKLTYQDVPAELKIKIFEFDRNDEDIARIKMRVKECREYIKELLNEPELKKKLKKK
jgi:hypothetical protein